MKNRTILGIILAVLALVIMFVVAPYFSRMAENNVECVRLKSDVLRGTQLTAAHLEVIQVPAYAIPTGAYKSVSQVVGKYSTSQLYAGDYLTAGKLSSVSISAADVLENMGEGKVAISVPITSFSGSLSGKLQNGDVVRFWLRDEKTGEAVVPEELRWVKLVTTTTGNGIDKDQIIVNDDGSFSMPSTVTVVVSELQAERLVECANKAMYLTLVYRGNDEKTQELLSQQDALLKRMENDSDVLMDCILLKNDVQPGTQITAAHLEVVAVPAKDIPADAYKYASEVIGKYATAQLSEGDFLTAEKLSDAPVQN